MGIVLTGASIIVLSRSPVLFGSIALLAALTVGLNWTEQRFRKHSMKDLTPLRRSPSDYALRFENLDFSPVSLDSLRVGDEVLCESGRTVPADGEVIDGIALVDESIMTGESAPVVRDPTPERRFVTEGTRILTNHILVRLNQLPDTGFNSRLHALFNTTKATESKHELAARRWTWGVLVCGLILYFVLLVLQVSLGSDISKLAPATAAIGIICLIPVLFLPKLHRLLGLTFLNRIVHRNLIPRDINTLELAGDVKTLALSRPAGGRRTTSLEIRELIPAPGVVAEELARLAQLAALNDESETNRAIVKYVKSQFGFAAQTLEGRTVQFISSSSQSDLSGIHIFNDEGEDGVRAVLIGSLAGIRRHVEGMGGAVPQTIVDSCKTIAGSGDSCSLVCDGCFVAGILRFHRTIGDPFSQEIEQLRDIGLHVVSIVPAADASAILDKSHEATAKHAIVKSLQHNGEPVAYIGGQCSADGPALAQADLSLVSTSGIESLIKMSHATNVSGDLWRFKHLFATGQEMQIRSDDLNALCIAGATAIWLALIPIFGSFFSKPASRFQWLANPLHLSSTSSALLASSVVAFILVAFLATTIAGLQDSSQRARKLKELVFRGPIATWCLFGATLFSIKALDFVLQRFLTS